MNATLSRAVAAGTILLLSSALVTCRLLFPERRESGQVNVGKVTIPETTKGLEDPQGKQITFVSANGTEVHLAASAPILQGLEVGDILAVGVTPSTPYGLLRKVIEISPSGAEVILFTEQAALEEAIEEGEFRFSRQLNTEDIAETEILARGVDSLPSSAFEIGGQMDAYEFHQRIENLILYDLDENEATMGDQILANGYIAFNLAIDFYANIQHFQIAELRFTATATDEINIEITSDLDCEFSEEREILLVQLLPIPLNVLGLPVIVTPKIKLVIGVDGSATAHLNAELLQGAEIAAGIQYDGQWSPIARVDPAFDVVLPTLTRQKVNLMLYAGPMVELLLNGIVAPSVALQGSLELSVDPSAQPWWVLYGGLRLVLGVDVEVIGQTVVSYRTDPPVVDVHSIIAQASDINSAPRLSNGSVNPPSGGTSTAFTFAVDYYDADNDSPTMRVVSIDGIEYSMMLGNGAAANGRYIYSTQLSSSNHTYYFRFSDGANDTWLPSTGIYSGPIINWSSSGDTRITNAIGLSRFPSLTWTGSEYGMAWADYRDGNYEIYFARIDSSGAKQGSDVRVTNATGFSYDPSLVWTGSEYGVVWTDKRDGNYEIYFARIDSSGVKQGSDVRVTNATGDSSFPILTWTGSEYGVAWADARDSIMAEIYFTRIDSSGAKQGSDVRVTNATGGSFFPFLIWTGSEYGVVWDDYRDGNSEIYFSRIDSSGTKQGSDIRVTNATGSSIRPSLAWTGGEYGTAWDDWRNNSSEIYFSRIDSSGLKQGSDRWITTNTAHSIDRPPSFIWTGSEYGGAWTDDRDGNSEIYFARIDSSGTKQGSDIRITNATGSSYEPSLIWTGCEYGVAWTDERDGNCEIYFAIVGADE